MNEKEYELLREVRELIWGLRVWAREGADGKRIRDKIWQEIIDVIERYKKENPRISVGFNNERG